MKAQRHETICATEGEPANTFVWRHIRYNEKITYEYVICCALRGRLSFSTVLYDGANGYNGGKRRTVVSVYQVYVIIGHSEWRRILGTAAALKMVAFMCYGGAAR